jgi:glycine oxidase
VSSSEVAVIGGGIVGLVSAKAAIDAGLMVTLFDESPGTGASFAAAGMICPSSEFLGGFAHEFELATHSASLWPRFAQQLEVPLHRSSTDVVGWTSGDRADVARYVDIARTFGVGIERVNCSASQFDLSPRLADVWRFPNELFVDVSLVLERLIDYVRRSGAVVNEEVLEISPTEGYLSVSTKSGTRRYRRCIIATGAHSLPVQSVDVAPVRAVRGVSMRARGEAGDPGMIRAVIDGRQIYAVRHPDGLIVIGAVSDEISTSRVEVRDVRELTELISTVVPGLGDAEFLEVRSGLRPTTSDARSFFHVVHESVAVTSGYFRHGILMAPVAEQRAEAFWRG